jgi:polyisoprenyl-phosphate glycosyltransferase
MDEMGAYGALESIQSAPPSVLLVIPVFNEKEVIYANLQAIAVAATEIEPECSLRMLIVDDGSSDRTIEELARYCAGEERASWIGFTRNFGKEAAIHAGLDHADADAVVVIDSDLQHPPELIPQMVALWKKGLPVVEAWKSGRGKESFASRLFAAAFYTLFGYFSGLDLRGQSDFKLLDRHVVVEYRRLPERRRFFRGLVQWMNYPSARLPFVVPPRAAGQTSWGRWRLLRYALGNLTSFSALPLQLISWMGVLTLSLGFVIGSISIYKKWAGVALDGFTTVILLIVFASGVLMLSLGIIGHYLARIYEELKLRPHYVLKDIFPGQKERR